jgi:hypothetical protein
MSGTITAGYDTDGAFWAVETCTLDHVPEPSGHPRVGEVPDGPGKWLLVRRYGQAAWVRPDDHAGLAALGITLSDGTVVRRWG